MENSCIYVVTVFEKLPDNGTLDCGCTRTPGYYLSLKDAIEAVENNYGDIWETCYLYACISELKQGFYNIPNEDRFYKYIKELNQYVEISKPRECEHLNICGIG
jgi:hypothetical protein